MSIHSRVRGRVRRPIRVRHVPIVVSVFTLCLATGVRAQLKDVAGSKDNPLIQRYEGSVIIGYDFRKFDGVDVLLGPVKQGGPGKRTTLTPTKSERVEGEATRLLYVVPEGRSPLEVLQNYEQDLQKAGFKTLFQCARQQCGTQPDGWLAEHYLYPMTRRLKQTPPAGTGRLAGQVSEFAFSSAKDQHYLAARRAGPQGDAYATLYVATSGFHIHKDTFGRAIVLLDVVETAPMESKMVTVDAATMAKDVAATGHVAVYGIYFDTDKTDIKPESAPVIAEIAKFLAQDPKLTMYVVGHTDNVGGYDYNMGLSQRRAAAVVQQLTGKHGIAAARLKSAGTGPLAPVAPNDAEEGRAKNRRVELVKQ